MKHKMRVCAAVCALVCAAAAAEVRAEDVKTITVMPYRRQEIKGWGFFPTLNLGGVLDKSRSSNNAPKSTIEDAVMSKLINDFGITMFRQDLMVQCGNADGSLNTDWMDKLTDALRVMIDGGVKEYMLTAWGVPEGMYYKDAASKNYIKEESEDDYCTFVVNAFKYITDKGLPAPIGFSIMNEPQDGRHWERVTMKQYARITKKMRKALDEGGFSDVMLLGPENAGYYQYFDQMGTNYSALYDDPEFAQSLGALITHSYYFINSGGKPTDTYRFDMNASNFPHMERWETEFSGGMSSGEGIISMEQRSCILTTQIMTADIVWSGMNRWLYWNGFDFRQYVYPNGDIRFMDSGKLGSVQSLGYGDGVNWMKKTKGGVSLSTIWKNVPIGSVVHRLWTDDKEVKNDYNLAADLAAFERKDGTNVLVIINESNNIRKYNVNGVSGKSASVYTVSDSTNQMAEVYKRNVINDSIKALEVQPYTVNIIVTDNEDTSPPLITVDENNSCVEDNGVYGVSDKNVTITGSFDEAVKSFTVNGESVGVSGDNTFSYTFDASKTNELTFSCSDAVTGIQTQKTLRYKYDEKLLKIFADNYTESTNQNKFIFKGHTNRKAEITDGKTTVNTDEKGNFEIPVDLNEGENEVTLSAKADGIVSEIKLNIFCDSKKPVISIEDTPDKVNDFEYLFKGSVSEELNALRINGESILVHDDLTFEAKAALDEGENEITFAAEDKYGNITEEKRSIKYVKDENSPHFVNGIAYARRTEDAVKIDGKLDESDWKTDLKISRQVLGAFPANNIVNFGLLWDDKNLYIGAEVRDGKLFWDNKAPYLNDSIEFLLNPSNEKAGAFTADDRQVFTGPINGDLNSHYQNKNISIECEYNIHKDGYTVEIAVPWSEMKKNPGIGEKIGFEIVCNDDDLGGSNRDSIQTWTSEIQDYYGLTTTFGTIELTDKGVFRYEDIPYTKKTVKSENSEEITQDGVTYYELGAMLEKYGSQYYDNPTTGLVNVFTSPTRRVDIKENAYQIFVDGKLVQLDNPIIKKDGLYYADKSFENAVFADIEAFKKYWD